MKIFHELKSNRYPNRMTLAGVVEAAVKTIQRDIDFMRDRMQMPIEYDRDRRGYYFTEPMEQFPLVQLTEAELVSVFVAQKALIQYKGTSFEAPLKSAFDKLISGSGGTFEISWEDLDASIAFRAPEALPPDTKIFQVVSEAVKLSKMLTFDYKKLESNIYEPRRLEPYQVLCFRNQWYCIGHDLDRDAMRTFVLFRMKKPHLGVEGFRKPLNFSAQKHFKNSFGIFSGSDGKPQKVLMRFDSTTAQHIRERVWHVSQEIQELSNGELELSVTVNSFVEIEAWIMSWGDHVQVLEPKELVNRLRDRARRMLSKYEATP